MPVVLISAKSENKQLESAALDVVIKFKDEIFCSAGTGKHELESISMEAVLNFKNGDLGCMGVAKMWMFERDLKKLVRLYFSDVQGASYTDEQLRELYEMSSPQLKSKF